jgi:Ricin-type beta-trefoil lectin domain-like
VINTRSGKCLDVGNGAPGTQATIQTCNGSSGQNWVIR